MKLIKILEDDVDDIDEEIFNCPRFQVPVASEKNCSFYFWLNNSQLMPSFRAATNSQYEINNKNQCPSHIVKADIDHAVNKK